MAQHQQGGSQQGSGIREIFPGDVRCGAVHGFENGASVVEIRAGHQAETAHKCGAQVGDDVAVEVFEHQHVVLVGIHHQLHAGVVDDVLAIGDLGIFLRDGTGTAKEQTIGELHDVGFVDGMDLLAFVLARIVESETRDAGGGFRGDDLQALDHAGNNFMLDAGIKALGIFANDDQVNVRIASRNVRKIANGPEVCVELEALAQLDVNAGKAAADRRRHRSLRPTRVRSIESLRSFGMYSLYFSKASAPAMNVSHSNLTPVASRMRTVALVTSGPMPSPGMSVMWCVIEN